MNQRFDERIKLNMNRLLHFDDTYSYVYQKDASMSWPGDFVGRYSLALSCLYEGLDDKTLKEEVLEKLKEIVSQRKNFVNKHHYFGSDFDENLINEQQMSGNSWYIRSLVSYYKITNDEEILEEIKDIIDSFLLPVSAHYSHYPMSEERTMGEVSGNIENTPVNGFMLSSDIGCAFILLDGFVDAYSITHDSRLKEAIEEIICVFRKLDYLNLKCQTHATLTCSRAILRFYQLTDNKEYLRFVEKVFSDYLQYGMTLDYQNINWFNRKDSWTEPCCVIDSFILAKELFLITKENKYLRLFNRIATNGVRIFQRDNGGAGCTSIVVSKDNVLRCFMYEAWFCCSMRTGEGMKYLSKSRLIEMGNDTYLMMYPENVSTNDFKIDVDYYFNKKIEIKSNKDFKLLLYVPDGIMLKTNNSYLIKDNLLTIEVKKNEDLCIDVELPINNENGIYFSGDMLLTRKNNHVDEIINVDGKEYSYVLSSADYSKEELEKIEQYL